MSTFDKLIKDSLNQEAEKNKTRVKEEEKRRKKSNWYGRRSMSQFGILQNGGFIYLSLLVCSILGGILIGHLNLGWKYLIGLIIAVLFVQIPGLQIYFFILQKIENFYFNRMPFQIVGILETLAYKNSDGPLVKIELLKSLNSLEKEEIVIAIKGLKLRKWGHESVKYIDIEQCSVSNNIISLNLPYKEPSGPTMGAVFTNFEYLVSFKRLLKKFLIPLHKKYRISKVEVTPVF